MENGAGGLSTVGAVKAPNPKVRLLTISPTAALRVEGTAHAAGGVGRGWRDSGTVGMAECEHSVGIGI